MVQIVKSQNNYYVCEFGEFYGSFHPLADAETFIKIEPENCHIFSVANEWL